MAKKEAYKADAQRLREQRRQMSVQLKAVLKDRDELVSQVSDLTGKRPKVSSVMLKVGRTPVCCPTEIPPVTNATGLGHQPPAPRPPSMLVARAATLCAQSTASMRLSRETSGVETSIADAASEASSAQ